MQKRLFLLLLTLGTMVPAQAAVPSINPTAQRILTDSIKTYQSLQSYRDVAVLATHAPMGKEVSYQSISWQAPRYVNVVTTNGDSHSRDNYDGVQYNFARRSPDSVYASHLPLPDASYGRSVLLQYEPTGIYFTPFLAGINPLQPPFGMRITALKLGSPATLGGVRVDSITASLLDDPSIQLTYLIGQNDHLVRRITLQGKTIDGDIYTTTETHSKIETDPAFPSGAFDFHVPADAANPETDATEINTFPQAGQETPAFSAQDIQHQPISSERYRGKVLLLDFWASWCLPCRFQMPYFKTLYQKYHDQGLEIVGVSQDDSLADLQKLVKQDTLPWPQIHDGDFQTSLQFKAFALPFTVLIGRDGKIAAVNQDKLLLDMAIRQALAK